jgi:hypothetical protein
MLSGVRDDAMMKVCQMARVRSGKGRGKNKKKEKTRKVAVSRKAQAGTAPYIPDTSSLDVANEIARRRHDQTAAQQPPQQVSALMAGESSLDANATVNTAYDRMLARIAELEATVAQLPPPPPPTPGIGHNYPPPDLTELEEIKRDIALLKAQPPPAPAEAATSASKFVRVAGSVLTWFGNHLNTWIDSFMKASGKSAGITLPPAIWLTFSDKLTSSAAAILEWLMRLGQ